MVTNEPACADAVSASKAVPPIASRNLKATRVPFTQTISQDFFFPVLSIRTILSIDLLPGGAACSKPAETNVMAEIIASPAALPAALDALGRGECVAIPTETVYGLAADATDGASVARIYQTKRRPRFNPLICHVADMAMARRVASFDAMAETLAAAFWPGALTLVLPLAPGSPVHPLALAGLSTVAVRMPRGFARDLIAAFGRPLAAPSANASGRLSPTSAEAVEADIGDRIGLIVDGGPTELGLESTIVAIENGQARLLRPGGIPVADIELVAGRRLERDASGAIVAPGMMASHYAPRAMVRLSVGSVAPGEALLGFGPERALGADRAAAFLNLSPTGDLAEAARNLFSHLRALDRPGTGVIAVEPVPDFGLGEAINDRLARAAAPRGE